MSVAFDFNLEPKQAVDYLSGKGFKLTFDYEEMAEAAHHQAFTVAKVTRVDLLNDIFTSLNTALKEGQSFKDWQTNIEPTLKKKGWWGKTEVVDPKTGEVKTIDVGATRLRNIYKTNMRVAYSVQRHHSQRQLPHAVYWRYRSMLLSSTRSSHAARHGTILHRDDPWWQTNYPPNDWGCQCKVQAYSRTQMERRGLSVTPTRPNNIAGKDWQHNVWAGSQVGQLKKMELGTGLALLTPRPELNDLSESALKARFYSSLGIKEGSPYIDAVGDPMTVGEDLFTAPKGASKIKKQNRHLYIDHLASAISDPDEIYIEVENRTGKSQLVKKMFRYFKDENGNKNAFMALFTYQEDKTIGTTIYVVNPNIVPKKRVEKLIYQKKKE